jgi:hypothetical protein
MVSLDLCDHLQDCRTLPATLDLDAIRLLRISTTYHGTIQRLLRAAESKNDAALAAALRECIAASGLDPDADISSDAETVAATREQLHTLLASRSWRLTARLRAIGRAIRQMRVKTRRLRSHRSQRPS